MKKKMGKREVISDDGSSSSRPEEGRNYGLFILFSVLSPLIRTKSKKREKEKLPQAKEFPFQ